MPSIKILQTATCFGTPYSRNLLEQMNINTYNKTSQMHQFLKFIFRIKLYMFRTVPLSITRSFSLHTQQWYMSYRFADSLRAESGGNQQMLFVI